jgi:heme-degrading monooxygenase HmoA
MFARVTRIEGRPDLTELGIPHASERLAETQKQTGAKGSYFLVDRPTGRAMTISFFETEADLRTDAARHVQVRAQSSRTFGVPDTSTVEVYEDPVGGREPFQREEGRSAEGTFAYVVTRQGLPERVDAAIERASRALPTVKGMKGFRGGHHLVDRGTGRSLVVSLWDTEEDVRAVRAGLNQEKEQISQAAGGTEPAKVEIYEVTVQA